MRNRYELAGIVAYTCTVMLSSFWTVVGVTSEQREYTRRHTTPRLSYSTNITCSEQPFFTLLAYESSVIGFSATDKVYQKLVYRSLRIMYTLFSHPKNRSLPQPLPSCSVVIEDNTTKVQT